METYGTVDLNGLCLLVFGKEHTANLERELRRMREMYHNFKFIDVVPEGRIIKSKAERGNPCYRLVLKNDTMQRKIHLNIELDLVCAAIEKWNTRKIYGNIELDGQQQMDITTEYEELLAYQREIESELMKL
jgi:hypothetical protein